MIGLTIPDKDLKWNEAKEGYDYGAINWDEFWQVVGGNGPCNKERVDARRKAKEDGKWVVEAAMAFAQKEAQRNLHNYGKIKRMASLGGFY